MKAILNPDAVNAYIDFHKKMKLPYKITISNYTTRIESKLHDIYFMKREQSNRVFAAFSKVKSDCKKKPIGRIDRDNLQYYSSSFQQDKFYSDVIYNIDLKSAYASILHNEGFISKETYRYVCSLRKMDRLAALGMLAGKKNIFEVDENGDVVSENVEISETVDYFFFCVKKTAEIMNECAKHLGDSFLFSWVDGIYFLQEETASVTAGKIISDYLNDLNLKCTFEKLEQFNVTLNKDHFNCTYYKAGKLKVMKVPRIESEAKNKIINYLTKKNYENV